MTQGDWLTLGAVTSFTAPALSVLVWFLVRFARSEDE